MGTNQAEKKIDEKVYVVAYKKGPDGEELIDSICASAEGAIDLITNVRGLEQIIPHILHEYSWAEPKPKHDAVPSWEESRYYARIVPCTLREIERGSDDS